MSASEVDLQSPLLDSEKAWTWHDKPVIEAREKAERRAKKEIGQYRLSLFRKWLNSHRPVKIRPRTRYPLGETHRERLITG